jgi:hypothetical protein
MAVMDNLRISNEQRLLSIRSTTTDTIDVNYVANTSEANPMFEDSMTTGIYDFDIVYNTVDYLATVINANRGIFRFKVEVIDSFDRVIGNSELEQLLIDLINIIKPAHTEAIITFSK